MKKLFFVIIMVFSISMLSTSAGAQNLSEKFPAQLKAIIAAVKNDAGKLKGEPISPAGGYKSKLPLDSFEVLYNEPDDDDAHVIVRKAVETLKAGDWMKEIATSLKKLNGYTVKDSYQDKDYFTGTRETTKHTLVLLKGNETVLTVIERGYYGTSSMIEIFF